MKRMKLRGIDLDVKAVNDDGTFSGYGSVFDIVDSYKEIVVPGAFTKSLSKLADTGRKLPILWQHRAGEPIGAWTYLKEDDRGLLCDGELWIGDSQYAKTAYRGMQSRAITGLSIGYRIVSSSFNEKTGIRILNEVDLVEVSIVTMPANDEARIESVKARIAHGELPDLPAFEKILREAGFSKSLAAVIANHGLAHLLRDEAEGKNDMSQLIRQTQEFSLPKF